MLFEVEWTGKTNKLSALIVSVVDMRPSLALHSSGIRTGGVIDHIMTAKLEDAVGDNNPHNSEQGLGADVVL